MIEVRHVTISEHIPSMVGLLREHWLETEAGVVSSEPNPDIAAYQAMEHANNVVSLGAFENEELVGYLVVFTGSHHHYSIPFAQHDVLFVRKDKRDTGLGLRLIRVMRELLREKGLTFAVWHAKPGSALDKILARDCTLADHIYIERF